MEEKDVKRCLKYLTFLQQAVDNSVTLPVDKRLKYISEPDMYYLFRQAVNKFLLKFPTARVSVSATGGAIHPAHSIISLYTKDGSVSLRYSGCLWLHYDSNREWGRETWKMTPNSLQLIDIVDLLSRFQSIPPKVRQRIRRLVKKQLPIKELRERIKIAVTLSQL